MLDEVTPRRYRAADAAELTTLLNTAYRELEDLGMNFTAATQNVETIRRRVSEGASWVIEHNGQIAATLTMSAPPSDDIAALSDYAQQPQTGWLCQVAVDPEFRGRAAAKILFDVSCGWATGENITTVGLDTAVTAEHLAAMCSRWGFAPVDTVQFPGKTYASVVMTKHLL
jgi:N-acetylglutamate synthase-like GNAT family acetyltransferase